MSVAKLLFGKVACLCLWIFLVWPSWIIALERHHDDIPTWFIKDKSILILITDVIVTETTREEGQRGNFASISAATGISDLDQVLQQKTFTRSEIERLKALLHSNPYCSPSSLLRLEASTSGSLKKHGDERDNLHAITTPMVTSRDLEEEIASPVELAKAYMGSRPSKAALRQDLVMHNNATGFLKSPNTLIASKIANGFTTPRSRGRLAMYNMAHTPYARSPSTFTEKGITSSYGREEALTSSESAFSMEGKWYSLEICLDYKQYASCLLYDDIGSGGPLRRTRQKANLALKRRKRELGYTTLQQPDHASQKLLLMNKSELKIALRSLEKVDSPKLLSYPHDNQKSKVQHHERLHDSRELTSKGKEKFEENGPKKYPVKFIFL
ncbi:hypothetical protein Tco_0480529 [Tanacetum coccineum]